MPCPSAREMLCDAFADAFLQRQGSKEQAGTALKVTWYMHIVRHHAAQFIRWAPGGYLGDVSNEGFEAAHKLVKQVYARCTSRGGGRAKSSAMTAVLLWFYRTRLYECENQEAKLADELAELYSPANDAMATVAKTFEEWIDLL